MRHFVSVRVTPLNTALGALLMLASGWGAAASALPMAVTDDQARMEAIAASTNIPLNYAVGLTPSLTEILGSSGGVDVFSAGAKTLALRIHLSDWPANVPLYWQTETLEQPHVIEPRTGETQWLPDVPGEMARLTWASDSLPEQASVTLELVYHGYQDLQNFTAKAAGDSATCNIDVACSQARGWDSSVRATTFITVGNGTRRFLCSASLLNNTANDERPLLITARHCNITASNAASLNTIFNFQRSACGGANDGNDMRDVVTGSTWLTESASADTTLVVLSRSIPANFNAHFGAWSAVATAPTSGAGVHHPSGDQKKISIYSAPANAADNQCIGGQGLLGGCRGFNVDAWRVLWSEGTTEQGSSGSGLWNQNRALVGVLSGGSHSCSNLNGTDLFGRLSVAWDQSATLRMALDPRGGGTVRSSNGRDASSGGVTPTPTPMPMPMPMPMPSPNDGNVSDSSGGGSLGGLSLSLLALAALLTRRASRLTRGSHPR